MNAKPDTTPRMRLDVWLWTARVYGSRAIAQAAANGGHVHLNERAAKPAQPVQPGDVLRITAHDSVRTLVVHGLAPRRVPAREVPALYTETPESCALREAARERRRLEGTRRTVRPSPRERRELIRLRRGD